MAGYYNYYMNIVVMLDIQGFIDINGMNIDVIEWKL